jgi:carboxypeptidase PM20D1
MIEGGSAACNVLPQNMRAVINFRLNEGVSTETLLEHVRKIVADDTVTLRYIQANNPSATARSDGLGYHALTEALSEFYPQVAFIPGMTAGATDACRYECICDTCLRCSPFISESEDIRRGVHGTDERISIRSYIQGIRVLIRLMEIVNL